MIVVCQIGSTTRSMYWHIILTLPNRIYLCATLVVSNPQTIQYLLIIKFKYRITLLSTLNYFHFYSPGKFQIIPGRTLPSCHHALREAHCTHRDRHYTIFYISTTNQHFSYGNARMPHMSWGNKTSRHNRYRATLLSPLSWAVSFTVEHPIELVSYVPKAVSQSEYRCQKQPWSGFKILQRPGSPYAKRCHQQYPHWVRDSTQRGTPERTYRAGSRHSACWCMPDMFKRKLCSSSTCHGQLCGL